MGDNVTISLVSNQPISNLQRENHMIRMNNRKPATASLFQFFLDYIGRRKQLNKWWKMHSSITTLLQKHGVLYKNTYFKMKDFENENKVQFCDAITQNALG